MTIERTGQIVSKRMLPSSPGCIARSKDYFGLHALPGYMLIDHDAATAEGGFSREDFWAALLSWVPELAGAGVIWCPSGSSHIFNGALDITGLRGQHFVVMLLDASDGPRVMKIIADRAWLNGHGEVIVSKSGSLLERAPIDLAPGDAARLNFGGAECVPPLRQVRSVEVINDGPFFDSRRLVKEMTVEEVGRVEGIKAQAKLEKRGEAERRKVEHRGEVIAEQLPKLMKREGISASDAERRIGAAVDAAHQGVLTGDAVLTVVHDDGKHEAASVLEVLRNRDRWHGAKCLDYLVPTHRNGAADGMLFLHSTSPVMFSFDDGGRTYRLRASRDVVNVVRGARGELVEKLAAIVADLDQVFMTDVGPIIVDRGRSHALTVDRLMNLIGTHVVLTTVGAKSSGPVDLTREVAVLVLAALSV